MLLLLWQVYTKYPRCPSCYSLLAPAMCSLSELKWLHEVSHCRLPSPASNHLGDVHWGLALSLFYFPLDRAFFSSLCGYELSKLQDIVKDREPGLLQFMGSQSQTRLSDWPTTKQRNMRFWKWMVTLTLSLVSTERQKCLFISMFFYIYFPWIFLLQPMHC